MTHACVIGWPIEQSKSPLIHGYWMKELGVQSFYTKCAVRPEELAEFVARSWEEGLFGFNATMPHKEALMDLVEPDETARAVGAINTVYRGDKGFVGTSTDGIGWWASLGRTKVPKTALVLGAGGAAKSVIHTLHQQGVMITVSNRTRSRAEELSPNVIDWQGVELDGRGFDLIVNTSSCGMKGQNPIRLTHLDAGTIVSDLVYTPMETELLASAKPLGGVAVDGLGMLLHQAVDGFELWFEKRPTVTPELRAFVLSQ